MEKSFNKNISKSNTVTYQKDYTPQPSEIYPRNTTLVENLKVNYVTQHINRKTEQNLYDHLNLHEE